ncbi:MAG: glycosyltransferase family 4 protein [bacterium]|nr:glycosyltransferase family 4 protein [Candidatus Sumerlaeota bacterium]
MMPHPVQHTHESGLTIIHISTGKDFRGGERQVKLLTDGLARRGHRCLVACPPGSPLWLDRAQAPAGTIAAPLRSWGEFDLFAARRLARLARQAGAGILHAHTSHAHTLAWLAARGTGLPVAVSRRVDFPVGGNSFSRRKYEADGIHFIAISQGVKESLVAGGISPGRIRIVHSGVDPGRFSARGAVRDEKAAARFGVQPSEYLIVNVAALTDHKDQATLLRAASALRGRLPGFRLVIAGSGELEGALKKLSVDLSLESHVTFAGQLADLASLYGAADMFVLSSHHEGLCTSILDAMLAGLPVVAASVGGVPEIVEDGRTGVLVPPRDPQAMASAMESLLLDPARRSALAAEGRARVMREFTADRMVEGTIAAYRGMLNAMAG